MSFWSKIRLFFYIIVSAVIFFSYINDKTYFWSRFRAFQNITKRFVLSKVFNDSSVNKSRLKQTHVLQKANTHQNLESLFEVVYYQNKVLFNVGAQDGFLYPLINVKDKNFVNFLERISKGKVNNNIQIANHNKSKNNALAQPRAKIITLGNSYITLKKGSFFISLLPDTKVVFNGGFTNIGLEKGCIAFNTKGLDAIGLFVNGIKTIIDGVRVICDSSDKLKDYDKDKLGFLWESLAIKSGFLGYDPLTLKKVWLGKKQKSSIVLEKPVNDKVLVAINKAVVPFNWSLGNEHIANIKSCKVLISDNDIFSKFFTLKVKPIKQHNVATYPLYPGVYYWKVACGALVSNVERFIIISESNFKLRYPYKGYNYKGGFVLKKNNFPLKLEWEKLPKVVNYIVSISRDKNFNDILSTTKVSYNVIFIDSSVFFVHKLNTIWVKVVAVLEDNTNPQNKIFINLTPFFLHLNVKNMRGVSF